MYKGAGLTGLIILALFLHQRIMGNKWQLAKKVVIGAAEENKGRRTAGQVLANGGAAALLGACRLVFPVILRCISLMIAGSFAAATADTLSSELGMVYGRRFYNILTLKKRYPWPDGVVSLEGTLIGLIGLYLSPLCIV
jgi:uncharacterized protein (TIGR00297 family)